MEKISTMFPLTWESSAFELSLWTCLGILPQFLSHSFFRNAELITSLHCLQTVGFAPTLVVWSLDPLGWCAMPFILSASPPFQLHLPPLLQHINSSGSDYLPFPQRPRLFPYPCLCSGCTLCRECPSLPPHLANTLKWFPLPRTSLFSSPHSIVEISSSWQETSGAPLNYPTGGMNAKQPGI